MRVILNDNKMVEIWNSISGRHYWMMGWLRLEMGVAVLICDVIYWYELSMDEGGIGCVCVA